MVVCTSTYQELEVGKGEAGTEGYYVPPTKGTSQAQVRGRVIGLVKGGNECK